MPDLHPSTDESATTDGIPNETAVIDTLKRLKTWDMLDCADGPYVRRQLDAAIACIESLRKRADWLESVYSRELERQTVMTQNIIAAARRTPESWTK